ncbi:tRNA (adenosine(37)-N6)-dimethylallyltransferase MiaA [Falsiroseomonas bella]|uniref:tRNA dimethylallyltransferase n=1 Tax=Falsiroseomonas bella TaxID=2184016 RepID=A0A317FHU2_9PROT|nr:tRNA (adenosine(37)-N6)-dimethylallyltransferase MiaA [Falsiroseomonas bella]PWS37208.1 tRNA (adenosine(37)-N6)-dimethylallyltransferase MiaA [Falsiroseomonas bella]
MTDTAQPAAILVAGPTASGKSALALDLAERLRGEIINADSMQVYRELRIITARPSDADLARAPHALYGVRRAAEAGTAAWWRGAALAAMEAARAAGRVPILCGGTGMYFAALTEGLAEIPPIPPEARAEARRLLAEEGPAALHARLAARDPETAAALRPSDSQRLARAYEVVTGTGRGLRDWQRAGGTGPAPWRFASVILDPPREALRAAIAARWAAMLAAGALEEVRALGEEGLDPALPAMRAHGVPELLAHLRGAMTLEAASARAILNTGQYTKRQATWFRHHSLAPASATKTFHSKSPLIAQDSKSLLEYFAAFVEMRD